MSKIIILFIIYSFYGFIWESIYCTIKTNKWQQRGFLFGPICPIYGTGAILVSALMHKVNYLSPNSNYFEIKIFLVSCIGSAILEFTTATFLEKKFHASWWDYSKMPFNIQGKTCLPCTLGFGIAGIVVTNTIIPYTENIINSIPNFLYLPISYILIVLVTIDFTLTISQLTDFVKQVELYSNNLNEHMSDFVEDLKVRGTLVKEKAEEEREKFANINIQKILSGKDFLYKQSIKRINTFKFKNTDKTHFAKKVLLFIKTKKD